MQNVNKYMGMRADILFYNLSKSGETQGVIDAPLWLGYVG